MQNSAGAFIVLEGADGSGKTTQFRLLEARLRAVGYDVEVFDFPRYDSPSSHFVRRYLAGDFGPVSSISPYSASLFYALDRFEAGPDIKEALAAGKVVLSNRYVGSNMAHQGSKISDPMEQRSFFVWEDSLEYQLLGIPRPSVNVYLRVPLEISQQLVKERAKQKGIALDEHEKDTAHLTNTISTYELLCQLFPNDFLAIDCVEREELLGIPEISDKVWTAVQSYMPPKPTTKGKEVTLKLDEEAAPTTKNGDGQLSLVAKMSLLMASDLELHGLGSLDYSGAWGPEFYTPESLPRKMKAKYQETIKQILSESGKVATKLPKNSPLNVSTLPLAAQAKVTFGFSAEEVAAILSRLNELATAEAKELAARVAEVSGQKDVGKTPEAVSNILSRLAQELLSPNLAAQAPELQLASASPKNEFELLADALYGVSNLPKAEIAAKAADWSYQQKYDAIVAAANKPGGELLANAVYSFDALTERSALAQLKEHGLVSKIASQPLTPRYGYKVPEEIEQKGAEEHFQACFDLSLELFSGLQASDENLAPYAMLYGNLVRTQISITAEALKKAWILGKKIPNPAHDLISQMMEEVSRQHPIIASAIKDSAKTQPSAPKRSRRHRSRRKK